MNQRATTLTVAGVLLAVLVGVALLVPVPYVTESPGITADVLGEDLDLDGDPTGREVLTFGAGVETYPTDGELLLTTARITPPDGRLSLFDAFASWFDSEEALSPRDVHYPPELSAEEANEQTQVAMTTSQSSGEVVGVRAAGFEVESYAEVLAVVGDGPSDGVLRAGDRVLRVDDVVVEDDMALRAAIGEHQVGDEVVFTVRRDDEEVEASVELGANPADESLSYAGITPSTGFDLPFEVDFDFDRTIGGPSAGSIFALAVYDRLTPGQLTGGEVVAGTGTVDFDGTVGGIGGIQQKMVSSQDQGATVFLSPGDNCAEALEAPVDLEKMRLVRIDTVEQAIDDLEALADDPDAEITSCETS